MAGQVDIIISKQAMAEIETATAKLEALRLKVLEVNKAGAKTTGVSNNDNIVQEIQKTNQLIAAQKNLISTKKKSAKAIVGTARALSEEINQLKKEQNTLTTSNKSWLQYEMRIMKVQVKLRQLTATQSQVSIATRKSGRAAKSASASFGGLSSLFRGFGILSLVNYFKELALSVFDLTKQFDSLKFAMDKTSATVQEASLNSRFLLNLSRDLGLELITTSTRFIKFAAAARNSGVALKDTQKIFGTMAKAGAVLGLRTDELGGVFLALEQMLSKGKVTTEELRRQLGERLPGAFGIMAASLGVTLPKLDEMLKKGELLSADVLPGFAEAVEIAFGLDTVNKVNTVVAAQNRLTTAWQNFIKNLTSEGSFVNNLYKGLAHKLKGYVDQANAIINKSEVDKFKTTQKAYNIEINAINAQSKKKLEASREEGNKLADLQKAKDKAVAFATGKINNAEAEKQMAKALSAILDYNKEIKALNQKEAEDRFKTAYKLAFDQQTLLNELKLKLETQSEKNKTELIEKGYWNKDRKYVNLDSIEKEIEEAEKLLQKLQGTVDADRLLGQKTKKPEVVKEGTGGAGMKGLNDIADFERKKQAEILATYIKTNELKIKSAEAGDLKVLDLLKENNQKQKEIAEILEEDKIDILTKSIQKQKDKIQKGIDDNTVNKAEGNKNIELLDEQLSDKTVIITEQTKQQIEDIDQSYRDKSQDFVKKDFAFRIAKEKGELGQSKTNAREKYENEIKVLGLTKKQKKKIYKDYLDEKDKAEIASHNRTMDLMIEQAKALAALSTATDAQKQSLASIVKELEGRKKTDKVPVEEDDTELDDARERYQILLGYASEYADALTGIATGILDGKIADIDAEMEATRLKYDEMFLLAEGDAKQTKLLKIQEAEDFKKLEKKKRKLQRQKAIFEKANAIIQIAINTAVGVSRATALAPAGLALIPIIIGLGALQTAAVLAQPLPKFAQGGIMGHDGLAVVGDGGKQEVIRTPDGKLSLTPNTDTVVNLKKGTEIFSSVDKFNQQNPNEMSSMLHSASLLASISLNQKNINGMMSGKQQLDERLLDAMLLNTKAVKKSQSNTYVKTQNIDIAHELWKSNLLN